MKDTKDLLEGLRRSPSILSEFINSIPEDRMNVRRGKGFWTVAEHIIHLAEIQPMLLERIQQFIHEDHPNFVPYNPGVIPYNPGVNDKDQRKGIPDASSRTDVTTALERFARYRKKQLALLKDLDGATWRKTGTHPEYELYSLYLLVRHMLMHDFWHMYRMEELWLAKNVSLPTME